MSKTSNSQREQTLREWIAKNIKNKSKDCVIFCDPSKRRLPHEAFKRSEAQKQLMKEIEHEEIIEALPGVGGTAFKVVVNEDYYQKPTHGSPLKRKDI